MHSIRMYSVSHICRSLGVSDAGTRLFRSGKCSGQESAFLVDLRRELGNRFEGVSG